jgi:hypothetical protein
MIKTTLTPPERALHQTSCPACGFQLAITFYTPQPQPLATLGWPGSPDQALQMPKLPLHFVRCLQCGHIFNRSFDYQQVPYIHNPNRMYNHSENWQTHLHTICALLLKHLPGQPVVVEIGCGEAQLLNMLAHARPEGTYIGFDPHAMAPATHTQVCIRTELFEPHQHLTELKPDILISRHVLEHLINPLAFIQETAFFCNWHQIFPLIFIEVPCIDRALATERMTDFYYEHNSHFSSRSFEYFLRAIHPNPLLCDTGYAEEVIFGLTQFSPQPQYTQHAQNSLAFLEISTQHIQTIRAQLTALRLEQKKIAFWGGTGKSAAFFNSLELTAQEFPLVVDSDPHKIGTCVPGTGQRIQAKQHLKENPVDIIIITSQWRAQDIFIEIQAAEIPFRQILIEHRGKLIDYLHESHPYHAN